MDAVNIFYRSLRIVASDLDCELIPVHNYWAGYLEEQNLSSGASTAGAGGSFPKRDIPRLAESIQPPAGAGGFVQRGKDLVLSDSRYPNERGRQVIAEAMIKWLGNVFDYPSLSS
jgi:hypothetical protein